jgi:hypothetical protein
MAVTEQCAIPPGMALGRRDVADAAVMVLVVVPVHEAGGPLPGGIEISKALGRERGAILGSTEQGFDERVVVADPWAGVGGPDAEPLSPCRTGLAGMACTPSPRAVRRARWAA